MATSKKDSGSNKKSKSANPQKANNKQSKSDKKESDKKATENTGLSGVGGERTIGSMMGEIVWLMSQSPGHKHLALSDLEWLLMPPIILNQYKLFRDGAKPVGAALWAYLSEDAEKRLKEAGRLAPQDWGNNAKLDQAQGLVPNEGGTLWLVELIAPFHVEQNKHREQMISDLMQTVFKGKKFKMMHINPETRQREEINLGGK